MTSNYKITVVGAGYVGMSLATILAQNNHVTLFDIDKKRVSSVNAKKSTIKDKDIDAFLNNKKLNLLATNNSKEAFCSADFVVVSTPTNFDPGSGYFDTTSVETTIKEAIDINKDCTIIIKSTIPVGFTEHLKETLNFSKIFFSPEFLRESLALHDNLFPSRIIIGGTSKEAKLFAKLLFECSLKEETHVLHVSSTEAEAIKLFSNTFLAMRVAYFNELDTFGFSRSLNVKNIIEGVSLDPRIGNFYNNPSFGYGGYCLPKDTKQLLANYSSIPQKLIQAIVDSNNTRQDFIADSILQLNPKCVGIYKLSMKLESDNFRSSSIQGVMKSLMDQDIELLIYEPALNDSRFMDVPVEKNLQRFKKRVDIILANRLSEELSDVESKIFSRDIFQND